MVHTASAQQMLELQAQDDLNVVSSDEYAEVSYGMMNTARAPFDSLTARKAVAHGIDLETFNQVVNEGAFQNASGPFAPGSMGYVEDTGIPEYDLEEAKKLVAEYERESGEELTFDIHHTTDAEVTAAAQLLQQQAKDAGIEVGLIPVDQAELIETVIGNEWQIAAFRNHPGGDPDTQYNWWHSTMPTNFGKFKDEVIDDLLDRGRQSADPEEREQIYQDVNKRLGEQVYNYWLQWTVWTVASTDDIFGVMGPDLPSGKGPFPGLATGHPVSAVWIQQ
jgi:peptide/nickel transport system substrate-binding protein